jgi:hypothetical protein
LKKGIVNNKTIPLSIFKGQSPISVVRMAHVQTRSGRMWYNKRIAEAEIELSVRKVPRKFWGYILANGVPGTDEHDGLGAIFQANDFWPMLHCYDDRPECMGITVVDGRDLETIEQWIGGIDWTPDQVQGWIDEMNALGANMPPYLEPSPRY